MLLQVKVSCTSEMIMFQLFLQRRSMYFFSVAYFPSFLILLLRRTFLYQDFVQEDSIAKAAFSMHFLVFVEGEKQSPGMKMNLHQLT